MKRKTLTLLIIKIYCILLLVTGFWLAFSQCNIASGVYAGSKVELNRIKGKDTLTVNGKPFIIKGVGLGVRGDREIFEVYFKLAKEMGVNSIRQWNAATNEQEILDLAEKYGLMINLGIWINWNRSYKDKSEEQRKNIMLIVEKYKDHPALLMWNVGNENISKVQDEFEKNLLCRYLERICQDIKKIDPNHPVSYTGNVKESIKYFNNYMPSFDVYGFNSYGNINKVNQYIKDYGLRKPYLFSEFGPHGWWETRKDANKQPKEPSNTQKARQYLKNWHKYIEGRKRCLGGFAFILNDKYEGTKTWWGIVFSGKKTASFWALREAYKGIKIPDDLPEITNFFADKVSHIKPNSTIRCAIKARGHNLHFNFDAPKIGGASWDQRGTEILYRVPAKKGVYFIYAIAEDNKGNIATASKSISVR